MTDLIEYLAERTPDAGAAEPVDAILARTGWNGWIGLTPAERDHMRRCRARLIQIAEERAVYGLTRGFGPLADYDADPDPMRHGLGLVNHLSAGQGGPLPPEVARTTVWLRLRSAVQGYSAFDPSVWRQAAELWNAGFTPVMPKDGSLSASGDLIPLAHAAQAMAGTGEVWRRTDSGWRHASAGDELRVLGMPPIDWDARSALAFVNGSSASLAATLHNHARLAALARAAASATARLVTLLDCSQEPYAAQLSAVRNQRGQCAAAALIRAELDTASVPAADRPFQEPYSLRCGPQVIGAVLDQLRLQGAILAAEAGGVSDNPVLVENQLFHGGNFHAAPVALVSEQYAGCVHQIAYLMERQLALVLDPARNGGRPPLLTPTPGRQSGFAGVQLAATSHLGAIRQRGYPASFTSVPTNLGNQDHVPLALNSANAVSEMLDRAWWIAASLFLAINQLHHLTQSRRTTGIWSTLAADVPKLTSDRSLARVIAETAATTESHFCAIVRMENRPC